MAQKRYYVGVKGVRREVFTSSTVPTEYSHGDRFNAVIGPFSTKAGATIMAESDGSPAVQTVADAERIARGRTKKSNEIRVIPDPPKMRIFNGNEFELWSGEYGPDPQGHTQPKAQEYAKQLRGNGYLARIVPYGGRYLIYYH